MPTLVYNRFSVTLIVSRKSWKKWMLIQCQFGFLGIICRWTWYKAFVILELFCKSWRNVKSCLDPLLAKCTSELCLHSKKKSVHLTPPTKTGSRRLHTRSCMIRNSSVGIKCLTNAFTIIKIFSNLFLTCTHIHMQDGGNQSTQKYHWQSSL